MNGRGLNGIHEELHEQANKTQTAAPFNNFFKYWREYKKQRIIHVCNVYNECLQQQQQQLLNLYPAVPYIDLHDTKNFDKYIERVQAAHNNH